jgi:hypothetical protein
MDQEPWFEPKSHGYGAGMPIHPNGWRLLGLYIFGMTVSALVITVALPFAFGVMQPKTYGVGWTMPPLWLAVFLGVWLLFAVAPMTAWFMAVARARTRGGWRWRRGGRDSPPQ